MSIKKQLSVLYQHIEKAAQLITCQRSKENRRRKA